MEKTQFLLLSDKTLLDRQKMPTLAVIPTGLQANHWKLLEWYFLLAGC